MPEQLNDVVLVSLLLTLNKFTPSSVFMLNFKQVNACWNNNDNNNDDNIHDEDVDRIDFTTDLILLF